MINASDCSCSRGGNAFSCECRAEEPDDAVIAVDVIGTCPPGSPAATVLEASWAASLARDATRCALVAVKRAEEALDLARLARPTRPGAARLLEASARREYRNACADHETAERMFGLCAVLALRALLSPEVRS